jgi:hypothetical protein
MCHPWGTLYTSTELSYCNTGILYCNTWSPYSNTRTPYASTETPYANAGFSCCHTKSSYLSTEPSYCNTERPYESTGGRYCSRKGRYGLKTGGSPKKRSYVMQTDYIPRPDGAFLDWVKNLYAYALAHYTGGVFPARRPALKLCSTPMTAHIRRPKTPIGTRRTCFTKTRPAKPLKPPSVSMSRRILSTTPP